ncbi:hypothetical protein BO71DRAFT_484663 [Aspergillus ellipticus CBS 707.79]|uniref:Cytochrome P450 n=1 Tax=Aspergillus ellipticus CBS 707.79 TaxID=1448320 RepID=A0A319D7Z2_9EURO|nr:hypothetical protein BO71DRAFT_484663 [Aspergillus ellipticus CBS 707.79]
MSSIVPVYPILRVKQSLSLRQTRISPTRIAGVFLASTMIYGIAFTLFTHVNRAFGHLQPRQPVSSSVSFLFTFTTQPQLQTLDTSTYKMSLYTLSVYIILLLLAIIAFYSIKAKYRATTHETRITNPKHCRQLIAGDSQFLNKRNLLSPLESREIPNRRIKTAFDIDNALTTTDKAYAHEFVHKSRALMNLKAREWHITAQRIHETAREWFSHALGEMPISKLVQSLSLRLVFLALLDMDLDTDVWYEIDLLDLAEEINRLWMIAKDHEIPLAGQSAGVREILLSLFPYCDSWSAKENPLNLVLPGFETTWRVALRMILEIRRGDPSWVDTMVRFARRPTMGRFKEKAESGLSPEDLVLEALRLYPPTKRIYRTFQWEDEQVTCAADIESCHLSEDVWGRSAQRYDPFRWANLTREQREAFMPFGAPPFECPAKPTFGPKMIAIIVGVVLTEMGDIGQWRLLYRDGGEVNKDIFGRRFLNDRTAYDDLMIVLR